MLLITGITGHTGKYFLQELMRNNYKGLIRCIVRETSDTSFLDNSGLFIEKFIGDVSDEAFIDKCMNGVDTVFHIANIKYSPKIVKIAVKNNIKRAILVHTTGIYSKFKIASQEYKNAENELEKEIKQAEIKVTILRPTMIYGDMCDHNISKFIKMIDKLRIFPAINNGKGLIQPVNARDLGKAYYDILMASPKKIKSEYNLSGNRPITMLDTFKLISDNLGKKTIFINFPISLALFMAKCLKCISIGRIDYIEKVQRMGEDRDFSHDEAKKDFGYSPEPFKIGIAREVNEYLKEKVLLNKK
jgi:nucleoside-diphosphate-sugar epimerase